MGWHGMVWHGMVWYGIKFVSSETNGRPGLSFHFFFSFIRTIKHFLSPLKPPLYHLFTLFHQIRIKLANKSFSIFHYLAHPPLFRTFDPFVHWIWGESRKLAALGRICVLRDALIPGARVSNGNILPHYRTPLIEPSGETRVAVCAAGGKRRKRKEVEKKTRSTRPGVY